MFFAQQCAEKSLKEYLAYHKEPLRRIHDLAALIELCKRFDADFTAIALDAADLNPYVCGTRYPDDSHLISYLTTLRIAVKQAQHIYEFVVDKIV